MLNNSFKEESKNDEYTRLYEVIQSKCFHILNKKMPNDILFLVRQYLSAQKQYLVRVYTIDKFKESLLKISGIHVTNDGFNCMVESNLTIDIYGKPEDFTDWYLGLVIKERRGKTINKQNISSDDIIIIVREGE